MSHGLLQRLAERALGLAQPLRSQRAVPTPGASQALDEHAGESNAALPAAVDRQVGAPQAVVAVRSADAVLSAIQTQEVNAPQVLVPPRAVAAPSAARHLTQAASTQPVVDTPNVAVIAQPLAPAALPSMAPLLPVVTPPQAMTRPMVHAEPRPADRAWPAPPPLLPEQPAQAVSLRSPLEPRAPALQERSARRAVSADRATEVHVSIGRVELTALAPPPNAARPARTREPSRSLSDYLRPTGKGKS